MVECDAPAPTVTYREHAAAAPVVTPAPAMMEKFIEKLDEPYKPEDDDSVCGKWASEKGEVEYIASAAAGYAGPAPNEEKFFISMTRLEEVSCAALTVQRRWRWTRKRIVLNAESEERLQEKLREIRRRLVACLPVGAIAKEKTENLRDMQSTLKAVEKIWRMIFEEELANLELDLGVRSRRVEWLLRCCDWGWRQRFCWPR